jgi:hypothetical protein
MRCTVDGLTRASRRETCTADHLCPRAAGMPRASNSAAMARNDLQRENRPRIDRRFGHAGRATRHAGRAGLETAALEPEAASTGRADESWSAIQIANHGDCRNQQRDKIRFRRLPLASSRAGQAIEDTRSARAGQSRQSRSRQFPAAAYIPKGGRSQAVTQRSIDAVGTSTSVQILSATPAPPAAATHRGFGRSGHQPAPEHRVLRRWHRVGFGANGQR